MTQLEVAPASDYGPIVMNSVGLFAGIGGIERGLELAGFGPTMLCEVDRGASTVLAHRFDCDIAGDVQTLPSLPACTVLSAGFPCQDLSQAGRTAGIRGKKSGLVGEVFRLLDGAGRAPDWVLLENVPFMLSLDRGQAMRHLTRQFGERGYRWAYRILDARAFGVPQRRRRVIFLASKTRDPRPALLGVDKGMPVEVPYEGRACGFYWTEGNRGLGWAIDAVPTLKGGSGLGIPSPPAIWMTNGSIVTPDIRDAERMQGFEADWTLPTVETAGLRIGARWKQVGNAVCVPMARWVGERLKVEKDWPSEEIESLLDSSSRWPKAAWGEGTKAWSIPVSEWPVHTARPSLQSFLKFDTKPLSLRATSGFRSRLEASTLNYPAEFMRDLKSHELVGV